MSVAICCAVFGLIWLVRSQGGLQHVELKAYDVLLNLQRRDYSFVSTILIVGVDEADLQRFSYPISDGTIAEAIVKLQSMKASVIGLDILRDMPAGSDDGRSKLRKIFEEEDHSKNWNVIGVNVAAAAGVRVPGPPGASEDQVGAAETIPDPDGILRRGLWFLSDPKTHEVIGSLNLKVALAHLSQLPAPIELEPVDSGNTMFRLGRTAVRRFEPNDGAYVGGDAGGYQFLLDYRGPARFEMVHLRDVIDGSLTPPTVRGKIVLIGMTTSTVKDLVPTPIRREKPIALGKSQPDSEYGVEFQAKCVDQYLRFALNGARPILTWSDRAEASWTFGWCLLGGMLGAQVRRLWPWTAMATGLVAVVFVTAWFLLSRGVWIPLLPPMLGGLACAALVTSYRSQRERTDRDVLMRLFSGHVSSSAAREIWEQREQFLDGGKLAARQVPATVVFTDLAGFTSMCEAMSPAQLMEWLNEYMDSMTQIVERSGGMVNKYIGDAIMAVFGVPMSKDPAADAKAAVACALEMRTRLGELNLAWAARGMGAAGMRIGVFSGPVIVGSLGSAERMEYAVLGDTVNTAQRLEAFDKGVMGDDIAAQGCRILIGEPTRQLIGSEFRTRAIGEVLLKGKRDPLAVYGVIL